MGDLKVTEGSYDNAVSAETGLRHRDHELGSWLVGEGNRGLWMSSQKQWHGTRYESAHRKTTKITSPDHSTLPASQATEEREVGESHLSVLPGSCSLSNLLT